MMEDHYRQAGSQNGSEVTYQDRDIDTDKRGEEVYSINNSEDIPAKIRGEDSISKDDLAILDVGKVPEDGKVLMIQNMGVDKNDAFEIDGEVYEVFKVADHYGEGGKIAGQRVLIKPE